ncbi:MAG: hypothetical protein ACC645_26285 [Pirellulales bacterium]
MASGNISEFALLDGVSRMLEQAKTLDEIANLRDKAEAARADGRPSRSSQESQTNECRQSSYD